MPADAEGAAAQVARRGGAGMAQKASGPTIAVRRSRRLDDRRAEAQIALIDELEPDVFLMQEAKSFEAGGDALLHALEADQNARVPCREEIIA